MDSLGRLMLVHPDADAAGAAAAQILPIDASHIGWKVDFVDAVN